MKRLTSTQISALMRNVYEHYDRNQRDLPWRKTTDPYKILVSEIMLQQTQVDRVIDKYNRFIEIFPTVQALAQASPAEVITVWQGLGYNRRALYLQKCAQEVVARHNSMFPDDIDALRELPGIGPYTAAAVRAFAFNLPGAVVETNIRTVFIHHFFKGKEGIMDKDLLPLIDQACDRKNPRKWYNALMDYGTKLKAEHPNPSRKSAHYQKQSRFEGSDRQARGIILKLLVSQGSLSQHEVIAAIKRPKVRAKKIINHLIVEGLVSRKNNKLSLSSQAKDL